MSTAAQTVKRWEHCPSCDSSTGIRGLGRQWICLECSHRFSKPVEKVSAEDYTALERRVPTWQPIETAPKDGTKIIVLTVHGEIEISEWYVVTTAEYEPAGDGLFRKVETVFSQGWNGNHPTHWMPLPEPPKEQR